MDEHQQPTEHGMSTLEISRRIWEDHTVKLKSNLNLAIFPYLVQEELMSRGARSHYTDETSTDVKVSIIINEVPRSGREDYLFKFISCLKDSAKEAGEAHDELVDLLEKAYKEFRETGRSTWSFSHNLSTTYDPHAGIIITSTMKELVPPVNGSPRPRAISSTITSSINMRDLGFIRVCIRRKYRKWIIPFLSSLLWLLLGVVGSLVLTGVPAVGTTSPHIIYKQSNMVVELGIDPEWVSQASLSIVKSRASVECTGSTLHIVSNSTCALLPTTVHNSDKFPYYLYSLPGSYYNITIKQQNDLDGIFLWIVKSAENYDDLISSTDCRNLSETEKCYILGNESAGVTLPLYEVDLPDYYFIFTTGKFATVFSVVTYTINNVAFNMSAIQDLYRPISVRIEHVPKQVEISRLFSLDRHGYCIILSTGCKLTSVYELVVSDISRRIDIELLPFVVGCVFFVLHLIICSCVFIIWRRRRAGNET